MICHVLANALVIVEVYDFVLFFEKADGGVRFPQALLPGADGVGCLAFCCLAFATVTGDSPVLRLRRHLRDSS